MASKPTPAPADLPPDVTAADAAPGAAYAKAVDGVPDEVLYAGLTFYKTAAFGWVVCTLNIGAARQKGGTGRTYGITLDGKVVRVGAGPHVLAVARAFVTAGNRGRLQRYVDLWSKGMADAGTVRDRISTRRAQGQIHRAAGRTSWAW